MEATATPAGRPVATRAAPRARARSDDVWVVEVGVVKRWMCLCCFFFQAEDGIRDYRVTGVQTCALPICLNSRRRHTRLSCDWSSDGSEEHTSELQSHDNLVCRLLLIGRAHVCTPVTR